VHSMRIIVGSLFTVMCAPLASGDEEKRGQKKEGESSTMWRAVFSRDDWLPAVLYFWSRRPQYTPVGWKNTQGSYVSVRGKLHRKRIMSPPSMRPKKKLLSLPSSVKSRIGVRQVRVIHSPHTKYILHTYRRRYL